MLLKISRLVLSLVLCFSLIPLVGVSVAWADENLGGESTFAQDDESRNKSLDEPEDPDVFGNVEDLDNPDTSDPDKSGDPISEPIETGSASSSTSDGVELASAAEQAPPYSVEYRAHVQNIGWLSYLTDGETAGTTGRSLRLEALNIRLLGTGLTGSIEYRAHVQNIGWQNWVADDALSGTTGKSLAVEAVGIRLTNDLSDAYDVYYRVHVQNYGWLGWAINGEDAGTSGYSLRMEAIEICLVEKGEPAPGVIGNAYNKRPMTLNAQAHVQNIGWQNWVAGSAVVGTTGYSLRMEAFRLQLISSDYSGSVEYRAHVQNIGWQNWVADGAIAGTTGYGYRMEALQIRLTGDLAANFDVYYRAHIPTLGWLGWAKNEETAGTVGFSCRTEAIQVILVPSGGAAPGSTYNHTFEALITSQANVAGLDWLSPVVGQSVVGTVGQAHQMEAFKLSINGSFSGGIEYNAYVQSIGWQPWVQDNDIAGTIGEGKRIEAIRIRLTGDLANYFDVYYRAHSASWGWLGWAANGAYAGTTKVDLQLEAFQVALVVKGTSAPGSTYGFYWESPPLPASYMAMNLRVANASSSTGWLIAIDSTNCLVGVYSGSRGNWTNRYMWLCSPGTWYTPTVKGTYYIGSRGYVFGSGYSCYYWTQFYGDYLFHSVLYYPGTNVIMEGTMGVPGSHGCVRLDIQNAKWIYDNIPTGTTVISY